MKVQLKNLERMNQTLMLKQSMSEQQLQQGMRSLTTAGTGDWPRTSNHLDSMFSLSELLAARRQNAAASSHANFLLYGGQS